MSFKNCENWINYLNVVKSQGKWNKFVVLHIRFCLSILSKYVYNIYNIGMLQLSELQRNGIGESSLRLPSSGS